MQNLKRLLLIFGLGAAVALSAGQAAFAAPIVCPNGQTAVKTSDGWQCVNNGDNPTGAGRHKGTGDKL